MELQDLYSLVAENTKKRNAEIVFLAKRKKHIQDSNALGEKSTCCCEYCTNKRNIINFKKQLSKIIRFSDDLAKENLIKEKILNLKNKQKQILNSLHF
jgi:hypothetical protein